MASAEVRQGLIGGSGIIAGAILGAVTMYALMQRDASAREVKAPKPSEPPPKRSPLGIPAPVSTPPPAPGTTGRDEQGPYYIVASGDTGAIIADRLGYPGMVMDLVEANPQIKVWRLVQPGTRLNLPRSWTTNG